MKKKQNRKIKSENKKKSNAVSKFLKSFTEVSCYCKADVRVGIKFRKCPGCGSGDHLDVKKRPY